MTESWVEREIPLKFLLGEILLGTVTFPTQVLNVHFTRLPANLVDIPPCFDDLPAGAEAMFIRSCPVDTPLQPLVLLPRAIRYVPAQYMRYYVNLQGSFTDYLKKFSAKSRSTLLRKVRKFAEHSGGDIRWQAFHCCEEMPEFYRLARAVSQKTYQERLLGVGIPDTDDFRREIARLAAQDLVRSYILFLGETPVAYLFCPVQEGVLLYQYLGYDPLFRAWSPGTVLQHIVLEQLFAERKFSMFDFTEGEGSHKKFFSTGSTRCADIYYFRRTPRNLSLLGLHMGTGVLSDLAVKTLNRVGLKNRIKNFLRSQA